MTGKRIIGFLIGEVSGAYNNAIWNGVTDAFKGKNICLICYSGGNIRYKNNREWADRRNFLYSLAATDMLDGIIFTSTTLQNFITQAEYQSFCSSFLPVPAVSIGHAAPDIPQCIIENSPGMYNLIEHLIKVHGSRKIAYISGPQGSEDARVRLEAYKEALQKNNLAYDPQYVYTGDFLPAAGEAAVNVFLKERRIQFDALAAANDEMAIAAGYALQKAGFRIPGDIAVTGFDDTEDAVTINPPLSTVRQPLYEQAYKTARILLEMLDGKTVPRLTSVPAFKVIRQSCGCFARNLSGTDTEDLPAAVSRDSGVLEQCKKEAAAEIQAQMNLLQWQEMEAPVNRLLSSFCDQIAGKSRDFLVVFSGILETALAKDSDMSIWQEVLSILMNKTDSKIQEKKAAALSRELCRYALTLYYEMVLRSKAKQTARRNLEYNVLHAIMQRMNANFEISQVKAVVINNFRDLHIPSCYISLYDKDTAHNAYCTLLTAYDKKGEIRIPAELQRFPSKQLIPDLHNRLEPGSYIVLPLFFDEEDIGLVVMECAGISGNIYESLAPQLAGSLKGAALLANSKGAGEKLKMRNQKIESLVLPMIKSITQVTEIVMKRMEFINLLTQLSQNSHKNITETSNIIDKVAANFNKINAIINVIDDISVTVNLVAINASIEATHAGVFGKGFAVIAREIKKLSNSTKKHAEEIGKTLKDMISAIKESKISSEESIKSLYEQEKSINDILESLKIISSRMEDLSVKSSEILFTMEL